MEGINKMTLWIFGDSFSSDHAIKQNTNWCQLWGEQHFASVRNYSASGTSNDYITNKIIKTLPKMQLGDSVIVCWSAIYRKCILGHHPIHQTNDFVITSSNINAKLAANYYQNFFTEDSGWQELLSGIITANTILNDNGIKNVQLLGHSDIASDSLILDNFLYHAPLRCVPQDLECFFIKYCTKIFDSWCVLHSWHKIQSDLMNRQTFGWTHDKHLPNEDYDDYTKNMFSDFEQSGQNIFTDIWHLNSKGHKLFADYMTPILYKELL